MERQAKSPYYSFLILSLIAVATSASVYWLASISREMFLVLFLGLEGTVALASAFSPAVDELSSATSEKGYRKLLWWFNEAWKYRTLISYHPVLFYFGLLMLAISMLLSAIYN